MSDSATPRFTFQIRASLALDVIFDDGPGPRMTACLGSPVPTLTSACVT